MTEPIHIISLGAGVQSSAMALMAAKGEIKPMPKCAIFADTQAEPKSVYTWLDWLEKQLPFPVHRVSAGSITDVALAIRNRKTGAGTWAKSLIPAFIQNPDGTRGIMGRQCTWMFKLDPLQKTNRKLAGIRRGQKTVGVINWIGISIDEALRMKDARVPWAKNRWPLIEMGVTRRKCLDWMNRNGFPKPPRSA
jgi:3'-phosphoadenosine 5'-phosphosulfate sulfotransferase (PAPS reductase)/FAD synthetase